MKCSNALPSNWMKWQLLALGCLVVMSARVQAEDSCEDLKMELSRSLQWETTTTWRNLKTLSTRALSCDGDDDGVLDATEFSSCLHQLLNFERKLSEDPLNDKPACLEKFRIEADTNENNEVDFSEYLRWSSEWASLYGRNERGEPEQLPNEVNRIEENAEKQEERQKLIIIIVPESAKIAAER